MRLRAWHRAALALALFGVISFWLWRLCARDPRVNFLCSRPPAEWIVLPSVPDLKARLATDLETSFRREFTLSRQPTQAVVSLCAFKQIDLRVNGEQVAAASGPNWKRGWSGEIHAHLRPGTNFLEAVVRNSSGPAALWLSLESDAQRLASDGSW
ncbi:MAG TPA: hypothetical protein VN794_01210, partial [Methylomirabilota bacterium]|nr:hypothetical protein [Methylomirabilota bacterium]